MTDSTNTPQEWRALEEAQDFTRHDERLRYEIWTKVIDSYNQEGNLTTDLALAAKVYESITGRKWGH